MGRLIGFAGMSHLGIVSSLSVAAKGFSVIAFDIRDELVRDLQASKLPVHEPDLDGLLSRNGKAIRYTSASSDLGKCDLVVLAIDIPTSADNQSDLSALDRLADTVVPELKDGSVLVVLSQVRPGYTRALAQRLGPVLAAKRIQLYYQVETLIFGRAVERALCPERYMVGCADPSKPLPAVFQELLAAFGCPILQMRYESAELAKIAINIFLTASVTATNTLANLCEEIGANWLEIAPALKLDKRIGAHAYLSPGLGLSGGNLERDLATVQSLAAQHGTDARLIDAFAGNSLYRRDWVLRTLHAHLATNGKPPVVAVWGLAYKQDTHSIKNSPSLALISSLAGMQVQAYDPKVRLESVPGVHFRQVDSPLEACKKADVLVVMTPWAEFPTVDLADVAARLKHPLIIDPFGCLDAHKAEALGLSYFKLGFSTPERTAAA